MTNEEKKKIRLERAKRTALGRFLCRLFGDNAGQAMMEYVVLGVLVVAAVVGIVVVFGDSILGGFKTMITAITNPKQAPAEATANRSTSQGGMGTATTEHSTVTGAGAGGGASATPQ